MNLTYNVTKRFLTGSLKGMAVREKTSARFLVGGDYGPAQRRYRVERVEVLSTKRQKAPVQIVDARAILAVRIADAQE